MADENPAPPENNPTPLPRGESRPSQAPPTDFAAEIRKVLDAMVDGGEIEFAADDGPAPARPAPARESLPREDEETRFERFLAARDAKNKADSEEKQFRERVSKRLEAKPKWYDPYRP